jgi:hypothetical protein
MWSSTLALGACVLIASMPFSSVIPCGPGSPLGLKLGEATLFVKMRKSAIVSVADPGSNTLFEGLVERLSRLVKPRGEPRRGGPQDASAGTISG